MSCLVIDIGNTSTAMAVWSGGDLRGRARMPTAGADRATVRRALERAVARRRLDGAVLCSVVPDRNRVWVESLHRVPGVAPLVVTHRLKLGIRVSYPRPGRIGADRLANACAAADILGAPAIVADFGTATTFDAI
ncbi:MAG: type III pantothenate kinase, partial [Lentisphaerae bacterium]|nr:type III pantothenate kinase [Lentisphaerota bacterium]